MLAKFRISHGAFAALVGIFLCAAPVARSQQPAQRPIAQRLAQFAAESSRPGARPSAASGLTEIMYHADRHTPTQVDSVITGIANLAISARDARTRLQAASLLASAGARGIPVIRGVFSRIEEVYRLSDDPAVRERIVRGMSDTQERNRAVAFLSSIAAESEDHSDFPGAPWVAVSILHVMGTAGRQALESLRASNALHDARAIGYVDWALGSR